MTGSLTIPFTGLRKQYNNLRTEILDATDTVLRSGQLMAGNYTAEFENWLAKKNSNKNKTEEPPIPNYIGECFMKIA